MLISAIKIAWKEINRIEKYKLYKFFLKDFLKK